MKSSWTPGRRNGIHVGMQKKAKEPGGRVSDEWEELKVEGLWRLATHGGCNFLNGMNQSGLERCISPESHQAGQMMR